MSEIVKEDKTRSKSKQRKDPIKTTTDKSDNWKK